jgi:hypothetical protein
LAVIVLYNSYSVFAVRPVSGTYFVSCEEKNIYLTGEIQLITSYILWPSFSVYSIHNAQFSDLSRKKAKGHYEENKRCC